MDSLRQRFLKPRRISHRLILSGTLTLLSPAHIGGTDSLSLLDQPILRDHAGCPYIPGTTLAGVMRAYVHQELGGGNQEADSLVGLFGCRWQDDDGIQSPLIVADANLAEGYKGITEFRDGVRIDPTTGTVARQGTVGMKYDLELLPAGTRFNISFELILCGEEATDRPRQELFLLGIKGLEDGAISLGGRTRRGYGNCQAGNWQLQRFDLRNTRGMLEWLGTEGGVPDGWPCAERRILADTVAIADFIGFSLLTAVAKPGLVIELTMTCPGSLLIGSGGHDPDEADSIHIHRLFLEPNGSTTYQPVIPGTSLAGVLRQRALKIANTLAGPANGERATALTDNLFGRDMSGGGKPTASKVVCQESVIDPGHHKLRHARVSIDRWRGGALPHLLFEEDALFSSQVNLRLTVADPTESETGLVFCLIKDLFTGDLTIGGESGIGRGILYGTAGTVTLTHGNGQCHPISFSGDGRGRLNVNDPDGISIQFFQALNTNLTGGMS